MSSTTTIAQHCGSAFHGYGGEAVQNLTDCSTPNTGQDLLRWVVLGVALLALGLLARHLARARREQP